jgi:hypothetical protein
MDRPVAFCFVGLPVELERQSGELGELFKSDRAALSHEARA